MDSETFTKIMEPKKQLLDKLRDMEKELLLDIQDKIQKLPFAQNRQKMRKEIDKHYVKLAAIDEYQKYVQDDMQKCVAEVLALIPKKS